MTDAMTMDYGSSDRESVEPNVTDRNSAAPPAETGEVEGLGSAPALPAQAGGTGAPGAPVVSAGESLTGRPAKSSSLWGWRGPVSLAGGLLFALLGLMLVLAGQAHDGDSAMENARPADLVAILDSLEGDIARLEQEKLQLSSELDTLTSGTAKEALAKSQERLAALQILAGTTPVSGPGIEISIIDQAGGVDAADILEAVQELRDAGAESIEVAERRIVVNTWFADPSELQGPGITISGDVRQPPYVIKAIGNADTLATAMEIPGGVAATIRNAGAEFQIERLKALQIQSTVKAFVPRYAQPVDVGEK